MENTFAHPINSTKMTSLPIFIMLFHGMKTFSLFVKDLKNKPVEEKTKTTNEESSQDKIESIIKPSKKQAKTKEETTTSQKG